MSSFHTHEQRDAAIRHYQRMGESLTGDRRETSPYEITFEDSVDWRLLCKATFETADLEKFKKAIQNNYFFEMFVEDLPMWGYIGDTAEDDFIVNEVEGTAKAYLFPHLHFYLGYNKNKIVSAKVTTDVSPYPTNFFALHDSTHNAPHLNASLDGSPCGHHRHFQANPSSILLLC